ncbi:hypothetical protein ACJEKX_23965, partial [Escherichia coli]
EEACALARGVALEEAPPRTNPDLDLPASAWVPFTAAPPYDALAMFAAQLVIQNGRAGIVDGRGELVELSTRAEPIVLARADAAVLGVPT